MAGEADIFSALLGSLLNTGNTGNTGAQSNNILGGLLGGSSSGIDMSSIISQIFPGLMEVLNIVAFIAYLIWGIYLGKRVMSGYKGHKNFIITAFGTAGFGILCVVFGIIFGDGIAVSMGLDISSSLISSISEYLGALLVSIILSVILMIMFKGPEYVSAKDLQQLVDVVNSLKEEVYEIKQALKKKGILVSDKKKVPSKKTFIEKLKDYFSVRTIIGIILIAAFLMLAANFAKNPIALERVNSLFTFKLLSSGTTGMNDTAQEGNNTQGVISGEECTTVNQLRYSILSTGAQPDMRVPSGQLNRTYYLVPSNKLSTQSITKAMYMNAISGTFTINNVDYYVVDVNNYWCIFLEGETFCDCNSVGTVQ